MQADGDGNAPSRLARAEGFDDVVALLEGAVQHDKEKSAAAPAQMNAELLRAFAEQRLENARNEEILANDPTRMRMPSANDVPMQMIDEDGVANGHRQAQGGGEVDLGD